MWAPMPREQPGPSPRARPGPRRGGGGRGRPRPPGGAGKPGVEAFEPSVADASLASPLLSHIMTTDTMVYNLGAVASVSAPPGVADALREAILQGDLSPGEQIRQAEWAERLGTSRIPV